MATKRPLYQEIAHKVLAYHNCIDSDNGDWEEKHREWLLQTAKGGPSGSGIDCGTKIDLDKSTGEKLVFDCSYHHMNENGMYDGWTEHTITVTPSLAFGYHIKISGRNRNDIKEYLHEIYGYWLSQEVEIS